MISLTIVLTCCGVYCNVSRSPVFDEDDHEDIVGYTANLTNVRCEQMKYQDVEESVPSARLPADIQVFHCGTVLSSLRESTATTKTRRTPHLFQNRLAPVLLHKPEKHDQNVHLYLMKL